MSDSGAAGDGAAGDGAAGDGAADNGAAGNGPPPALLAVAISVPPGTEDDLAAWYATEHIPMLLAVPGWRRIRRFRLTEGTAPEYLALHEIDGPAVLEHPAYRAAVTTPWRDRIVASALRRDRRVFGLRGVIRRPDDAA